MFDANRPVPTNVPVRPRALGDYRLLRQAGRPGPMPAPMPGVMPVDRFQPANGGPWQPGFLTRPAVDPAARPQQKKGLVQRFLDWVAAIFAPGPRPYQPPFAGPNGPAYPVPFPQPAPFPQIPVPQPAPFPQPIPVPVPQPFPPLAGPNGPASPPLAGPNGPASPPLAGPNGPASPTPGETAGVKVFFTNTPYGSASGMTNEQANQANEASAMADPNNPDKHLVALIDSVGPGGTLDGAFFDIEVPNVVDALVRAKGRGVNVRLVTENDYYKASRGGLREPIQRLEAAGITVIPDDRPAALMHDKFLVANGQTVWTGSYNITSHGSYRENNNAMRIDSPEMAQVYTQEFNKMFESHNFGTDVNVGQPINAGTSHPVSRTIRVGTAEITPYFSPSTAAQSGCKGAIMAELSKATTSIQFMAFSFTDDDIGDLILKKAGEGVNVQGIFEKSQAASRYSEYKRMNPQEGGINGLPGHHLDVRIDTNPALMHHKVIIIDSSTLIMGSFNFSQGAQMENDENMLVIKNAPDLVAAYQAEFAKVQTVAIN